MVCSIFSKRLICAEQLATNPQPQHHPLPQESTIDAYTLGLTQAPQEQAENVAPTHHHFGGFGL